MIMINTLTNSPVLHEFRPYQHHKEYTELRDQRSNSYSINQRKYSEISQPKDRQLYELCQQLTKQNRLLRKQNTELKKELQQKGLNSQGHNFQRDLYDDYRQVNYESYKKKMMQVMSSLKYLFQLYCEKKTIKETNNILDTLMEKMRRGKTNSILQLIDIFKERVNKQDLSCSDIDYLLKDAASYQSTILKQHIKKMYQFLKDNIYCLRKDMGQIQQQLCYNKDKIANQIQYYCSKYISPLTNQSGVLAEKKQNQNLQQSQGREKKNIKKSKQSFSGYKMGWKQVARKREKIQEKKKIQNNVSNLQEKALQFVEDQSRLNYYSLPLSKKVSRPPKPTSIVTKHERTIVDELQISKNTGISGMTPKNRKRVNKSVMRDSSSNIEKKENAPNWSSYNNSGRKYYR